MSLEQAIEDVARDLPVGWEIQIRVENGGYSVELFDPMMNPIETDGEDGSMERAIYVALEVAQERSST